MVVLLNLQIETHQYCIFDYVKVFDTNGTLLRHLCGYLQQDVILYTTGNRARISFYSDGVIQGVGFLSSWRAVPLDFEEVAEGERKETYLLAFPQAFTKSAENAPENVCLQLTNVDVAGTVSVSLFTGKSILNGTAETTTGRQFNRIKNHSGNGLGNFWVICLTLFNAESSIALEAVCTVSLFNLALIPFFG